MEVEGAIERGLLFSMMLSVVSNKSEVSLRLMIGVGEGCCLQSVKLMLLYQLMTIPTCRVIGIVPTHARDKFLDPYMRVLMLFLCARNLLIFIYTRLLFLLEIK